MWNPTESLSHSYYVADMQHSLQLSERKLGMESLSIAPPSATDLVVVVDADPRYRSLTIPSGSALDSSTWTAQRHTGQSEPLHTATTLLCGTAFVSISQARVALFLSGQCRAGRIHKWMHALR